MLGGLLWSCVPCMKEPSHLRLLQVLGGNSRPCSLCFRPVGLPQVWMYMFLYRDCELQGDLRACFLQGLTESQDADQACESTFTSERYGTWVWAPGRAGHYSLLSPEPQLRHSCSTKEMLQPDGPLGLCLPPLQDKHSGSLGALASCVNLRMPLLITLGRSLPYSSPHPPPATFKSSPGPCLPWLLHPHPHPPESFLSTHSSRQIRYSAHSTKPSLQKGHVTSRP